MLYVALQFFAIEFLQEAYNRPNYRAPKRTHHAKTPSIRCTENCRTKDWDPRTFRGLEPWSHWGLGDFPRETEELEGSPLVPPLARSSSGKSVALRRQRPGSGVLRQTTRKLERSFRFANKLGGDSAIYTLQIDNREKNPIRIRPRCHGLLQSIPAMPRHLQPACWSTFVRNIYLYFFSIHIFRWQNYVARATNESGCFLLKGARGGKASGFPLAGRGSWTWEGMEALQGSPPRRWSPAPAGSGPAANENGIGGGLDREAYRLHLPSSSESRSPWEQPRFAFICHHWSNDEARIKRRSGCSSHRAICRRNAAVFECCPRRYSDSSVLDSFPLILFLLPPFPSAASSVEQILQSLCSSLPPVVSPDCIDYTPYSPFRWRRIHGNLDSDGRGAQSRGREPSIGLMQIMVLCWSIISSIDWFRWPHGRGSPRPGVPTRMSIIASESKVSNLRIFPNSIYFPCSSRSQ